MDDGHHQSWKALLDLCAARRVLHFNTNSFAPYQACFSEHLEVLREGRFRNCFFTDHPKVRTILRALRANDVGVDSHTYRVGERMEDRFDRNVFDRRMKEGPHTFSILVALGLLFNSSYFMNY